MEQRAVCRNGRRGGFSVMIDPYSGDKANGSDGREHDSYFREYTPWQDAIRVEQVRYRSRNMNQQEQREISHGQPQRHLGGPKDPDQKRKRGDANQDRDQHGLRGTGRVTANTIIRECCRSVNKGLQATGLGLVRAIL